ncbi:DUF3592 domain-containing protein [Planctomycetota bacterium]|nr:DUF3592 domain-containing protein [Planctomycetota bacterium]
MRYRNKNNYKALYKDMKQRRIAMYVIAVVFFVPMLILPFLSVLEMVRQSKTYFYQTTMGEVTQRYHVFPGNKQRLVIEYAYKVDGTAYNNDVLMYNMFDKFEGRTIDAATQSYQKGKQIKVYYNRSNPDEAVLLRGLRGINLRNSMVYGSVLFLSLPMIYMLLRLMVYECKRWPFARWVTGARREVTCIGFDLPNSKSWKYGGCFYTGCMVYCIANCFLYWSALKPISEFWLQLAFGWGVLLLAQLVFCWLMGRRRRWVEVDGKYKRLRVIRVGVKNMMTNEAIEDVHQGWIHAKDIVDMGIVSPVQEMSEMRHFETFVFIKHWVGGEQKITFLENLMDYEQGKLLCEFLNEKLDLKKEAAGMWVHLERGLKMEPEYMREREMNLVRSLVDGCSIMMSSEGARAEKTYVYG